METRRNEVLQRGATGQVRATAPIMTARPGHLYLVATQEVQELRRALARGRLPMEFEAKLAKLATGTLSEHYVEQNSHLFFALLLAALESAFTEATPSQREHLLRVLAYVRKDDDAIPDYLPDGYFDDHQEVRFAAMELAPLLHAFKAWRLRHQVPAMWRG